MHFLCFTRYAEIHFTLPKLIRSVFQHGSTKEEKEQVNLEDIIPLFLLSFFILHFRYGSDSFDISEIIESVFGSAKTKQEKDEV